MENAIRKSKEGGYKEPRMGWEVEESAIYAVIVLDPLFWQALGKACGWGEVHYEGCDSQKDYCSHPNKKCGCEKCDCSAQYKWREKAIEFHRINLTEGWDKACAYLKEVTK